MLTLDRSAARLLDARGREFDPRRRSWNPAGHRATGEGISPAEAVRWLQREVETRWRIPVGLIGPREPEARQLPVAEAVGAGLARLGFTVLCGGRQGVMEAACRGIAAAGGISVGLLPDAEWEAANAYVSIPIATGIGVARNAIIARACWALVAVGGGYGTISEAAFGLQFGRPVFGLAGAPQIPGVVQLEDWPALEERLCRAFLRLEEAGA